MCVIELFNDPLGAVAKLQASQVADSIPTRDKYLYEPQRIVTNLGVCPREIYVCETLRYHKIFLFCGNVGYRGEILK